MSESDISSHIVDMLESKSSHSDSFTDRELKILDDIVYIIRGIPASDSQLYNEPNDTRLPYIVSSDIVDRKIKCEKVKYLEPAENPTIDRYIIKENDILISIRGIAGKLALVSKELGIVIASSQIVILRIKTEQVSPEYLYYVLSSTYAQQQLAEYKVGKNISGLSLKDLRIVRIPVPSLLHQHEIVKRIKITRGVVDNVNQKPISVRIKERENYNIELKSSFRYDTRSKQSNPKVLEKVIAKTIAAFMNSEGGSLFIGVDDQGNVLGLEDDYRTLKKQDSDGFEIELRQSIEKYTKNKIANESFRVKFHLTDGKEICEVIVSPAPEPIVIHDEGGKQQEFYVRVGNSSKPYTWDEFYEYSKRRFK